MKKNIISMCEFRKKLELIRKLNQLSAEYLNLNICIFSLLRAEDFSKALRGSSEMSYQEYIELAIEDFGEIKKSIDNPKENCLKNSEVSIFLRKIELAEIESYYRSKELL